MRHDLAQILARPIAHRGLHDRARGVIENSVRAAEAAVAHGYGIECDIQLTRDGDAVVFHDDGLDRLTDETGPVNARTAAELATIALRGDGVLIPTLSAYLAMLEGRVPLVIEIKSRFDGETRLAARAIEALARYEGPVALKSFDPAIIAQCRMLGADRPLGLVGPDERAPKIANQYDFLSWHVGDLAQLRSRDEDLPVMSWTIRTREDEASASRFKAQIIFESFRPTEKS